MSENTKFNLEYAIKQGYRVADDFAASRLMFEKKHYINNTDWQVFVNWENSNYQEVNLNAAYLVNGVLSKGNQWVEMTNPGSAGIYYLLLRKGSPDQFRANFGRHNGSTAPLVEWLGEALTDNHIISMATGTALLITFLWDGTKYIAHIVPKEIVGRIPTRGYLYNWAAVNIGKLDIPGWHVPTHDEWVDLNVAIHQFDNWVGYWLKDEPPVWDGGDFVGFKALPTGYRDYNGNFDYALTRSFFWSSTPYDTAMNLQAWCTQLRTGLNTFLAGETHLKRTGLSIRLMRNNLSGYVNGEKVKDIDGNVYDTVRITLGGGANYDQVFLKQNLATGRYNDGVGIPYITNAGLWENLNITAGAMCALDNDLQHVFGEIEHPLEGEFVP